MTRTRYEFKIRDDENKAQLGGIRYGIRKGIRDKNVIHIFVLCEFQIHYFHSASQICFIYCVTTCIICNVQYSVLYSHPLSLIPS